MKVVCVEEMLDKEVFLDGVVFESGYLTIIHIREMNGVERGVGGVTEDGSGHQCFTPSFWIAFENDFCLGE